MDYNMSEPLPNEDVVQYIERIQKEDDTISEKDIVDNYKKYNTNHLWLQ